MANKPKSTRLPLEFWRILLSPIDEYQHFDTNQHGQNIIVLYIVFMVSSPMVAIFVRWELIILGPLLQSSCLMIFFLLELWFVFDYWRTVTLQNGSLSLTLFISTVECYRFGVLSLFIYFISYPTELSIVWQLYIPESIMISFILIMIVIMKMSQTFRYLALFSFISFNLAVATDYELTNRKQKGKDLREEVKLMLGANSNKLVFQFSAHSIEFQLESHPKISGKGPSPKDIIEAKLTAAVNTGNIDIMYNILLTLNSIVTPKDDGFDIVLKGGLVGWVCWFKQLKELQRLGYIGAIEWKIKDVDVDLHLRQPLTEAEIDGIGGFLMGLVDILAKIVPLEVTIDGELYTLSMEGKRSRLKFFNEYGFVNVKYFDRKHFIYIYGSINLHFVNGNQKNLFNLIRFKVIYQRGETKYAAELLDIAIPHETDWKYCDREEKFNIGGYYFRLFNLQCPNKETYGEELSQMNAIQLLKNNKYGSRRRIVMTKLPAINIRRIEESITKQFRRLHAGLNCIN